MTSGDLSSQADVQVRALATEGGYRTPWNDGEPPRSVGGQAIVAGDAHGLFVALAYGELPHGAELSPFETTVPLTAQPVLRGVPRVPPGTPIARPDGLELLKGEGAAGIVGATAHAGGRQLTVRRGEGKELVFNIR